MSKIYMYVDAENVSFDTFKYLYDEVKGQHAIVGKFYGGKDILGCAITKYLMLGFDYVETSTLSKNKKNLTDMKLIVDCMEDISQNRDSIEMVYLVSKDCDFLPLVYKVISYNVPVKSLITVEDGSGEKDITTLVNKLNTCGYLPVTGQRVLGTMYSDIMAIVGDEFESDLVADYVNARKRKLVKALYLIDPAISQKVEELPLDKFNFHTVAEIADMNSSKEGFATLFNVFTTKVFGTMLTRRDFAALFTKEAC